MMKHWRMLRFRCNVVWACCNCFLASEGRSVGNDALLDMEFFFVCEVFLVDILLMKCWSFRYRMSAGCQKLPLEIPMRSQNVGYKSQVIKIWVQNTDFFGVVIGSHPKGWDFSRWPLPETRQLFCTCKWMVGWEDPFASVGSLLAFYIFGSAKKPPKITRNSLLGFFGDKKHTQVEFPMLTANKGHALDRPARSASVLSCWKLDRNWNNRIC